MTEKRLIVDENYNLVDTVTGEWLDDTQVFDLANELAEEKEILEVQLNELSEENKRLKSDLTHTKVLYHSLQDTYSGLLKLVHGFNGDLND